MNLIQNIVNIDWEIYAGLRASINGNAGLVGILLPEFPFIDDSHYDLSNLPRRLADNVNSGYGKCYTWENAKNNFDGIVETAFNDRIFLRNRIDNSREQMQKNM